MKNGKLNVVALCLAAGAASCFADVGDSPTALVPNSGRVIQAAHIYYNMATGEQVVTLLNDGQSSPAASATSVPIWSSTEGTACIDQGFTTSFFFGFDDNAGTTSLATDIEVLDFGDIALDTVVDCVQIDWVTGHPDVDLNSDGVGDGVPGLGGQWAFWDADNGRVENQSTRLALISILFIDLPGNVFGEGAFTGYTADIDLVGSFSSSLSFEIGDSDGDLQGAAFGHSAVEDPNNPGVFAPIATLDRDFDGNPDSDLDGDGYFDWAWGVHFFQPGTADLDGDGVIDGDLADSMRAIGVLFGSPAGTAVDNGDGTWEWDIDTSVPDAGFGADDLFAIYKDGLHQGNFWFGGFSCTPDDLGQYTPRADFSMVLYGPDVSDCCPVDMNCDGALNFFDISAFLTAFANEDPAADFSPDGVFNFFDISAFLAAFAAGCP